MIDEVDTALVALFAILARAWWRQQHREESAIALVSMAAMFALLFHGIAEFNFSIPAIPATLAVVLGAGWTAATYTDGTRRRAGSEGEGGGGGGVTKC
jgi:predicted branched-subunit amino acid permease